MVPVTNSSNTKHSMVNILAWAVMTGAMILLPAVPALSVPITWPVPDSHDMMNGFAAGTPNNIYKFHEGIDIRASGKGGEDVVAIRGGKVVWNNSSYQGGMVTIEVDIGGGKKEYDRYLHIDVLAPDEGKEIKKGDPVGKISKTAYPEGTRHLHLSVLNEKPPRDSAPVEVSELNPFMRFTKNADKDPLEKRPKLKDTNKDGKTLLITKSGNYGDVFQKQPIKGDVDLIADVVDEMSTALGYATNPHKVGYYIKPLFDKGVVARGVKNDSNPYLLAKFDDALFPGSPSTKFGDVYDTSREATNSSPYTHLNHFIVTNTKGENGSVANVDGNQFWNTNAKDDGAADTVAHANYAGKVDTNRNAQARFKDGEYEVHIMLGDLVNTNVDATAGKLRLDNYKQTAGANLGGIAPPQGPVAPLYGPSSTPYIPDFKPDPSIATIDFIFDLGDPVGIFGDQYYPNLLMPAYIFPHLGKGWLEDDPFMGFIKQILVQSDLNGVVPLTLAWNAEILGLFDVIIDYDRDGLFTWTMDGLGGFKVVPEPATVWLLAIGIIAGIIVGTFRKKDKSG